MVTRNERELYEASNSIIVRWDNEGIIRYINKVGLRFFGYSSEELIGQKVGCLIPNLEESTGRDLSSLVKNILEIPAEHVVFENENVTKEGKTVWIAWTNQAILNEQGEIIEILAIGNCISALKESEENLAKEKALLRTVIDSAEDLIYFKDRNSTYIGCNKVSEAFTGLAESEQIGKSDFDFFGQAQAEAIVKDDQNILENRTAVHTEDWVTSPVSGEQRVLDTVKAPILGPDGQAIGLVGISRDITERKKAEREITEANNFNQIIIENSPVGILVFKESGQCVQANPAAEIIVGASHEQMLKLNFREMETYKKTEILADMEEVFRTGVSIKKEIRTTNTFGKEVWFEGVISTFRKNEENYILYIFTDIIQIKKALEALQKSEERHRTIFQTAMDGIWFVDKKGCFLEVNESYCLMSGYSKQELLTMCISDVENIESPEDTIAHLEKLKDLGNVRFLSQHRRKDGRLFDVEVTAQTHNEDDIYYVAFLRDITELKKKELELKNSEEKTRLILDSAAEAIYGLDPFGNCTFCNQSCLNILGYRSDEELLGRNMHEVIHHSTVEGLPNPAGECQIFESFQHGEKVHIKNDHLWKADGTSFTAEVWSHPIRKDDAVIGAVVTFNDITKQKQSEEKLEQSHNLLSKLARLVPGVIYQYRLFPDGSSAFPYSSPGMNDIYEVSPEEVQEDATPAFGRLHPDDYDMVANLIQVSAQTLKTFYCEFRVILPRQGLRWRWSQAHPERLDDGSTLWHGLISDITERKQSEYEKEQLQIQLSQAQKIESIGQLAGGVAHDFNNILGVILGHTELALRKLDPASPLISDLEENRKAANRAAELTRQLLTFARKQAITPKVLDLNESVTGTLKMLQRLIGENIQLSWNPAANLWPVKADPSQIDQIMANLCVNSRDAISGTGKISIKTGNTSWDEDATNALPYNVVPGDYVLISVSDDGCGMDKETQSHIFEPFYTTKDVGYGTGLGLATVYGAVKQNQGFIAVYSEPGLGTVFNIYFPRTTKAVEAEQETPETQLLRGNETVLLVEDDEMLLQLVTTMLEESGYTVLAAITTDLAQTIAKEHPGPIHLLVSDVVMPVMNGKDLSGKLQPLRPEMKVLFLSGYTADIISKQAVIEDKAQFLQKPFSLEGLTSKVRKLLDDH